MDEQFFFFKIVSIGDFCMQFTNSNNVQNKPMISVADKKRKWGNSYIVFNNVSIASVKKCNNEKPMFVGKFEIDKKLYNYLKLFKRIDVPCKKADYSIVTRNTVTTDRMSNEFNLVKYDSNSFSRIFSSAYHQTENSCISQTTFILKDGDIIIIDNVKEQWNADTMQFTVID